MKAVVDLSNNNPGPIDWPLFARNCAGVIHKATEGTGFVDRFYASRKRLAEQHGIVFGAYHFAHTDQSAIMQAELFVRVAAGEKILALDLESGDPKAAEQWARIFNARVHGLTGVWPIFYSYRAFIEQMNIQHGPIGAGLWLADYGPNDGRPHPAAAPAPWRHVKLHQYTSKGIVAGVPGHVDLSTGTL